MTRFHTISTITFWGMNYNHFQAFRATFIARSEVREIGEYFIKKTYYPFYNFINSNKKKSTIQP